MSILVLQSSWWGRESWLLCLICLPGVVMVERLFFAVPRGCLRFVIVVFPDHTNLLFLEFLSLKVCITGSSESSLVKMPHCCLSHVAAQL